MTGKKRDHKQRLERRQRGQGQPALLSPLPSQEPSEIGMDDWFGSNFDDAELDGLLDELSYSLDTTADVRLMERPLRRMKRYLDRLGIDPSNSTEAEVEQVLASNAWLDEPDPEPNSPLEEAQELMFDAFEEPVPEERIRLAKQARKISRDCADAYVLLAEEASESPRQAKKLYQDGIKAGERALKGVDLLGFEGNYWSMMEARPYLRAIGGLAGLHWFLGEHEDSIRQHERLLELDKLDFEGTRYNLATHLLDLDRDDEVIALLDRFEDDTTSLWAWTRALVAYRQAGASDAATTAMRAALERNLYVASYMLGLRQVTVDTRTIIGMPPDVQEAGEYYAGHMPYWLRTPNAVEWLRGHVDMAQLRALPAPVPNWL